MAHVYRHHRYHGIKYLMRQIGRNLVAISRPLSIALTTIYLILPWLFPLSQQQRMLLLGIGIISGFGAVFWHYKAARLGQTMDIIAAGHDGEGLVAKRLARLPQDWAVLNDLALRVDGPIVQIDHLIITPAAIWVLETKTQKGKIITSPKSGQWRVKRRGQVRKIVNPVEQNIAQVEACRSLVNKLKVDVPCKGLVVMTESIAHANWPIVTAENLNKYIVESTKRRPKLNPTQIRGLAQSLLEFQVSGRAPWQKGQHNIGSFTLLVLLPLLTYILAFILG